MRGSTIGQKYFNDRGFAILKALDAVSARHGVNQAQVALAWLMQAPGITAPIASATSVAQVQELLKALDVQLTARDVRELQAGQPVAA